MRHNPIYPEGWEQEKFQKGERVRVRGPQKVYGIVTFIRHDHLGVDYYVKVDGHTTSLAFQDYELAKTTNENPVFPRDWEMRPLQKGDKVMFWYYSNLAPELIHAFGTVVSVTVTGGKHFFDVKVEDGCADRPNMIGHIFHGVPETNIKRQGDEYHSNPVYPEEWETFQKGERVYIPSLDLYGKILYAPIRSKHGNHYWVSRDDGQDVLHRESEIQKATNENPIYPEEWGQSRREIDPKGHQRFQGIERTFRIGDKVMIKPDLDSYFAGRIGTVTDVNVFETFKLDAAEILHRCPIHDIKWAAGNGVDEQQSVVDADRLTLAETGFQQNPVFPKEWHNPRDLIGKRFEIHYRRGKHRVVKVEVVDVLEGLDDRVVVEDVSTGLAFVALIDNLHVPKGHFDRNPIYPKEWPYRLPKVGDLVKRHMDSYTWAGKTLRVIEVREDEGHINVIVKADDGDEAVFPAEMVTVIS